MAMNYTEQGLRRLGDKDLAKIISGIHDVFRSRHPEMTDIPLVPESSKHVPLIKPDSSEKFLTVKQAADTLQTTTESVRRMIRRGQLKATMLGGTRLGYRIRSSDVDGLMQ